MSVEPEEVEAILAAVGGDAQPAKEVASRDFRQPRRLSTEAMVRVRRAAEAAVARAQLALSNSLGESRALRLVTVREVAAEGLLDEPALPLTAVEFEVAGQPGWLLWENLAAVVCIDRVLGGASASGTTERVLSRVERRMLVQFAGAVLRPFCAALGLEPASLSAPAEPAALRTWRDGESGGDNHRLAVELTYEHAEDAQSTFLLYLPGIRPGADLQLGPTANDESVPAPLPALPAHLEEVRLELSVLLGEVELALDDLLALEVGDVIPLSTKVGEPLDVTIEGRRRGSAILGRHRGALAVRVQETESVEPHHNGGTASDSQPSGATKS
jgi:flagellar motor switch protein FliM